MADLREGPRGARASPLFLDQSEARRAEKLFFGDRQFKQLQINREKISIVQRDSNPWRLP